MIYIIILIFVILLAISQSNKSNIFSPWVITLIVWILILMMSLIFKDILYPLGNKFLSCILLWVIFFYISTIFISRLVEFEKKIESKYILSEKTLDFLLIISILFTPLYFKEIYDNVIKNGTGSLLFDLRYQALNGENDFGILLYLKNYNKALLILEFLRKKISYKKIILISLINILIGISIMEKGTFLYVIFIIMFFLYFKKIINKKVIFISIIGFIILSFSLNQLRSHNSSGNIDFVNFFAIYVVSPSVAFETLNYNMYNTSNFGANTFPFFYSLSNSIFGTNYIIEQKLQEFVNVPLPTNVYTIMQPFFEDFGYSGIIVFGILFGTIVGYVYKRASHNKYFYGLYSYLSFLLLLQFFQEEFFVSFSIFLQICIIMYIPFFVNRINLK